MAQPMLCDAHGAPGVMLMNTLIPPVESMVFCEECLPAQIILIAGGLGILDEVAAVAVAEERARVEAEKPKGKARKAAAPATPDPAGDISPSAFDHAMDETEAV